MFVVHFLLVVSLALRLEQERPSWYERFKDVKPVQEPLVDLWHDSLLNSFNRTLKMEEVGKGRWKIGYSSLDQKLILKVARGREESEWSIEDDYLEQQTCALLSFLSPTKIVYSQPLLVTGIQNDTVITGMLERRLPTFRKWVGDRTDEILALEKWANDQHGCKLTDFQGHLDETDNIHFLTDCSIECDKNITAIHEALVIQAKRSLCWEQFFVKRYSHPTTVHTI